MQEEYLTEGTDESEDELEREISAVTWRPRIPAHLIPINKGEKFAKKARSKSDRTY